MQDLWPLQAGLKDCLVEKAQGVADRATAQDRSTSVSDARNKEPASSDAMRDGSVGDQPKKILSAFDNDEQ